MPSVNRIFPLRLLTAGAISLFLNITGAIAPVAPVLNTPLIYSEKATRFPEISTLLLYACSVIRWRFCKLFCPSQNIRTLFQLLKQGFFYLDDDDFVLG